MVTFGKGNGVLPTPPAVPFCAKTSGLKAAHSTQRNFLRPIFSNSGQGNTSWPRVTCRGNAKRSPKFPNDIFAKHIHMRKDCKPSNFNTKTSKSKVDETRPKSMKLAVFFAKTQVPLAQSLVQTPKYLLIYCSLLFIMCEYI